MKLVNGTGTFAVQVRLVRILRGGGAWPWQHTVRIITSLPCRLLLATGACGLL